MASATKQLSGHSDVLLGYVATAEPARLADLRAWRTQTGAIPGPFETWLAHRSLATLAVRVDRQEATAAEIAALLAARPDVAWSRWPGLGCVIAVDLGTADRAQAFLARVVADRRGDELRRRAQQRRAPSPLGRRRRVARARAAQRRARGPARPPGGRRAGARCGRP